MKGLSVLMVSEGTEGSHGQESVRVDPIVSAGAEQRQGLDIADSAGCSRGATDILCGLGPLILKLLVIIR